MTAVISQAIAVESSLGGGLLHGQERQPIGGNKEKCLIELPPIPRIISSLAVGQVQIQFKS